MVDRSAPFVATVAGTAVALVVLEMLRLSRSLRTAKPPPSDADRTNVYMTVKNIIESAGATANIETALLLLTESKASYERVSTGSASVEAKATTLLSLVAGASSALGIFSYAQAAGTRATSLAGLAASAALFIALGALLYVLRSKFYRHPITDEYLFPKILDADNRAGIALWLAQTYRDTAVDLRQTVRFEPLALFIAYVAIAAAAMLVLVGATAKVPFAW